MPPRPPLARLPLLERASHPPILPLPARSTGNNVPHSLHKTRRVWKPNTQRFSLPVTVLGDAIIKTDAILAAAEAGPSIPGVKRKLPRLPQLKKVKMAARDIKSVEKAGGVEGMLLSRPSSHFTPYGKALRHELFQRLHSIREEMAEVEREVAYEQIEQETPRQIEQPRA